jgi:acetyl-CoA carboxylase biotin carboxyl carrier protein
MASIDADVVRHALQVARDHGFAEVEIANETSHFRAILEPVKKAKKLADQAVVQSDDSAKSELQPIRASHVGFFHADGGRLEVGQVVAKGDPIASISALGLANEVESTVSGEIVEVLVQDGDAVEFGQPLAMVKQ